MLTKLQRISGLVDTAEGAEEVRSSAPMPCLYVIGVQSQGEP